MVDGSARCVTSSLNLYNPDNHHNSDKETNRAVPVACQSRHIVSRPQRDYVNHQLMHIYTLTVVHGSHVPLLLATGGGGERRATARPQAEAFHRPNANPQPQR